MVGRTVVSILVALLVLLCFHCSEAAGGVTSRLQVHIPKELSRSDGGYDHREALFGVPLYGGSIQQTVYYANQSLCDPNVDTTIGYPKRSPDSDGVVPSWPSPFILMVDRGRCTFVKKVRNAQRAGAAGVIIADDKCLCSAGDTCKPDEDEEVCENEEPIMADDGSGSDISIPSFLMFKQDADPIKKALKKNKVVRMEMAWALPSSDRKVEYDLFTTPTDQISRSFLDQFKVAAVALGTRAQFTPHMYIYDGLVAGCQGYDGENQCGDMCTNSGRYCATEPDGLEGKVTGADVVTEALRRSCIWNLYGKDGIGETWWTYVEEFMFRCHEPELFSNSDCIKDAYGTSGVAGGQVESCMLDSGGLEANTANQILEAQLAEREASGAVIIPSVFVNSATIRGALTFSTVFKAVCAGFEAREEPDVCKVCATCLDEYGCVTKGKCTAGGGGLQGGVSPPIFGITLLGLAFVFLCLGYCQFRRSQAQMREQVKGIMAEYMPLDKRNANVDTSLSLSEEDGEFT